MIAAEQKQLPAGWKWVKLGDVAETITDGDWILKENYSSEQEVRLLQVGDIGKGNFVDKSSRFISENTALELDCTFLRENDLLISRMPDPIGRACLLPKLPYKSITAVDVCIFRPNRGLLDETFAMHYMGSNDWLSKAAILSTGTTRKRISRRNLQIIPIPLPPLAEQKRIADILNKAEEIKKLREEADKKTEELIPAVFNEMVGDAGTNLKNWDIETIGNLAEKVGSGITPRGGKSVYVDDGPFFIRSQNVQMNQLDLSDVARIPWDIHNSMSSTKVLTGDVLLNITGASIGRVTWVPHLDEEANVNQHVCIIRLKPQLALPEFVSIQLSTPYFQSLIDQTQTGMSRQGLNFAQIRKIKLLVPPISLQSQFVSRVREIRGLENHQSNSQSNLTELKSSLLQRAFRGEL